MTNLHICLIVLLQLFVGGLCDNLLCEGQDDYTTVPDPKNCSTFFQCMNGESIEGICPEGSWFDNKLRLCLPKDLANCDAQETTTTVVPERTSQSTTVISTTTNGGEGTTKDPEDYDRYCKSIRLGVLPHPKDCHKLIVCFENIAVEHHCGDGLHFSARHGTCLKIEEAECTTDNTVCSKDNDPENIIVIANPYDCRGFFMCFDHKAQPYVCSKGQHWNQSQKTCILEENSSCKVKLFVSLRLISKF